MRVSSREFEDFYKSNLGQIASKIVLENIQEIWGNIENQNILGFGYCDDILNQISGNSKRIINYQIDTEIPNCIHGDLVGTEDRTPFEDSLFDKILCIHGFEESESPQKTLRELWRILAPEGSLIMIVPNRRGAWSRRDDLPFGHGRPYSRSQLMKILETSLFDVKKAKRILFAPPFDFGVLNNFSNKFEIIGSKLWPTFGGLLLFEIRKRVFIMPPLATNAKTSKAKAINASNFSKHEAKRPKIVRN